MVCGRDAPRLCSADEEVRPSAEKGENFILEIFNQEEDITF